MGIYYIYGIEYAIIDKNNNIHIIVPISDADQRLLISDYFKTRNYNSTYLTEWRYKISNNQFNLTNNEQKNLTNKINILKDLVLDHGWYDVGYITSTY